MAKKHQEQQTEKAASAHHLASSNARNIVSENGSDRSQTKQNTKHNSVLTKAQRN